MKIEANIVELVLLKIAIDEANLTNLAGAEIVQKELLSQLNKELDKFGSFDEQLEEFKKLLAPILGVEPEEKKDGPILYC